MKYEVTQEQYVDFLNTLNKTQKNSRWLKGTASGTVGATYRNYISWTYNSDDDAIIANNIGGDRACNYVNLNDVLAFLDWAALRLMSELEYEKACRGLIKDSTWTYAWGTQIATIPGVRSIVNDGTGKEQTSTSGANVNASSAYSWRNIGATTTGSYGPMRVGAFADSTSGRVKAGATYWGIMNMQGNLWEPVVTVGGFSTYWLSTYSGKEGDGELSSTGTANESDWPSTVRHNYLKGCHGGMPINRDASISDRVKALNATSSGYGTDNYSCTFSLDSRTSGMGVTVRRECNGFRGVRTASH